MVLAQVVNGGDLAEFNPEEAVILPSDMTAIDDDSPKEKAVLVLVHTEKFLLEAAREVLSKEEDRHNVSNRDVVRKALGQYIRNHDQEVGNGRF